MADENDKDQVEEPKTFLKFRASQKSPTLEVAVGEYRRSFKAEEQPFEMTGLKRKEGKTEIVVFTPVEEEQLLRNSGFFVSDKDAESEAGQTADSPDLSGQSDDEGDNSTASNNNLVDQGAGDDAGTGKATRKRVTNKLSDAPPAE
jgi:hypothetical protein